MTILTWHQVSLVALKKPTVQSVDFLAFSWLEIADGFQTIDEESYHIVEIRELLDSDEANTV